MLVQRILQLFGYIIHRQEDSQKKIMVKEKWKDKDLKEDAQSDRQTEIKDWAS